MLLVCGLWHLKPQIFFMAVCLNVASPSCSMLNLLGWNGITVSSFRGKKGRNRAIKSGLQISKQLKFASWYILNIKLTFWILELREVLTFPLYPADGATRSLLIQRHQVKGCCNCFTVYLFINLWNNYRFSWISDLKQIKTDEFKDCLIIKSVQLTYQSKSSSPN